MLLHIRTLLFFLLLNQIALAQFTIHPTQTRASCHLLDADTLWVGTENGVFKMLQNGIVLGRWTQPNPAFPTNVPRAMTKDQEGRLLVYYNFWGIRRFDGTNWEVLTDPLTPTIGSLSFQSIAVDDHNRILLSGYRLFRQNGQDWEAISPVGLEVQKMIKSPSGQYFFTGNNKIVSFDGIANWDSSDVYLPNMQLLFDICLDTAGDLYGIFYSSGSKTPEIWKFPQGNLANPQLVATAVGFEYNFNTPKILYATAICVDAQGRVLLNINGPDFHFIRWDGQSWTKFGGEQNGPFGTNQYEEAVLIAAADGSVWMSQRDKNQPLFRFTAAGFEPFGQYLTAQEGTAAPDGKIWFCGSRFLTSYDPLTKNFNQHFPKPSATQFWYSIGVAPVDGKVYAGDKTQIWQYDGQAWSVFHNFGAGKLTNKIEIGKDNWLWANVDVSSGNDILFGKNTLTGDELSFPAQNANNFNDLLIGPDTSVWVAHKNQLFKYKNGNFTYFSANTVGYPFNVPGITTEKMAFDTQGNLWVFISGLGLVRYDGVAWTAFTPQNSGLTTTTALYDFEIDANDNIWLSHYNLTNPSQNAIQLFNNNSWSTYTIYNSNVAAFPVQNIVPTPEGKVYFGTTSKLFSIQFLPRWLHGQVLRDANGNCIPESTESSLNQWIIQAKDILIGEKYFGRTFADGRYEINLDSAVYEISLIPPAPIWDDCDGTTTLDLTENLRDTLDFSGEKVADCPLLNLEISIPFLRRCFENTYHFKYCNLGTTDADTAWMEIDLPIEIAFLNASVPVVATSSTKIKVPIGGVIAGDCGEFSMTVLPDCDAELGKTLCLEAHIFPDSFCLNLPTWSGADLHASASCQNDTVFFKIKNKGVGGMAQTLEYIVIEDEVIMRQGPILLPPSDSLLVPFIPNSGYQRIQFPQEPGHPFFGLVSAAIEGCGASSNGWFFAGFPFEDPSPFYEIECAEVLSSFDPNDKAALPQGIGNEHFILPETKIEYKIRFQNTGNDTAFTVVLRDTLSSIFDFASLQIGAASHPFSWDLSGQGNLTFTFNNILLPDSTTNELESHGFVSFSIKPATNIPLPVLVENRAGIYFDFNEVVMTNTIFHTIDTGFLTVSPSIATENISTENTIILYPNPATDRVFISIKNHDFQSGTVRMTNMLGQEVWRKRVSKRDIEIYRTSLPVGIYFIEIFDNKKAIGYGKLVWK